MNKQAIKWTVLPALCALALTGCVSREQADAKLERGCAAAAGVFLEEGYSVKSVKQSTFGTSKEFGNGYRVADLTIIETDGWADLDKEVQCTFLEEIGAFGTSHSASLYQLKISGDIYGVQNGQLLGDLEEHLKLIAAIENAMGTR